ncbi:MAG: hypothetical protein AMXMBFR33_65670 [Candidatus Xenobia bacterium]
MQVSALGPAALTANRYRLSPRAVASPVDEVTLSAPPSARPVEPAARTGQLGPMAPVVEQELSRLQVAFKEKKWLNLWGSSTRDLTSAQAADRLERGKAGRLLVETDGKELPLTSKTDLAALEHLLGQPQREAPLEAQALKELKDAGYGFENAGAYEAYLIAQKGGTLVVVQGEIPCARASAQELPGLADRMAAATRQWDELTCRLEKDPAGATAGFVRHLGQVYAGRSDRLVASLPASPVRALASEMLKELSPDQVADRLELASPAVEGVDALEHLQVLQAFGWQSELAGLKTADRALRFQTRQVGFAEAAGRLGQLAAAQRPELVAEFAKDSPDLGVLQAALEAKLAGCKPGEALSSRPSPHQTFLELNALADELKAAGGTWYGHTQPLFRAYARCKPEAEGLSFLHQLVRHGVFGDEAAGCLAAVLAPVGNLTLADRARSFQELVLGHPVLDQSQVRLPAYQAWAAEVQSGASPQEASQRVGQLADALQASKQTWYGHITPVFRAHSRLAAGNEAHRALLVELAGQGVVGEPGMACLKRVLQPCGNTSLDERMQAMRELTMQAGSPLSETNCREATMKAWRAEVEAGASPAEATSRLQSLSELLVKNKITWYGYVLGALSTHEKHLVGTTERAERQAFLESLLSQQILGDELVGVFEQVAAPLGGTTLGERIAAFQELTADKPFGQNVSRIAAMSAWRAELEAGTDKAEALERLQELAGAMKQGQMEWYGHVSAALEGYQDSLAGGPELDGGRALLGRLVRGGLPGEESASVLESVMEPVAGLTLEQKAEELERLCLAKGHPFAQNGVREPAFTAFKRQIEHGIAVDEARERLESLAQAALAAERTWHGYLGGMLTACSENLQSPLAIRVGYAMLTRELAAKPRQEKLTALPIRVAETFEKLSSLGIPDEQLEALFENATGDTLDQIVETASQAAALTRRGQSTSPVEEGENHVVFQGVRVTKRGAQASGNGPEFLEGVASSPLPRAQEAPEVSSLEPRRPADDLQFAYRSGELGATFDHNNSTSSRAVYTAVLAVAGSEEKAREAYLLGGRFDQNNSRSSRAAYAVAAAIAGEREKAKAAFRLGSEFDQGNSHASRSLFTVAAALAGDRQKARQAHSLGSALDGGNSARTRAFFTIAAAIAGDGVHQAAALGSRFDNNNSTRSRCLFTIAAAIDPEKAEGWHDLASEFDRNNSTATRAMFTIACAIAGTEERARQAYELAGEMDRNNSTRSRAMFTIACAAALNPENARYATPINYGYLYDDD